MGNKKKGIHTKELNLKQLKDYSKLKQINKMRGLNQLFKESDHKVVLWLSSSKVLKIMNSSYQKISFFDKNFLQPTIYITICINLFLLSNFSKKVTRPSLKSLEINKIKIFKEENLR